MGRHAHEERERGRSQLEHEVALEAALLDEGELALGDPQLELGLGNTTFSAVPVLPVLVA